MAIRLAEKNIGEDKYIHKFRLANDSVVEVATTQAAYDNLHVVAPTLPSATWLCSSIRIGFDTPSGNLGNEEFATQENGYHWVKLTGYRLLKIDPEYIVRKVLSTEGEAWIKQEGNEES